MKERVKNVSTAVAEHITNSGAPPNTGHMPIKLALLI